MNLLSPLSFCCRWLAYSDLNYKGEMTVLEECDSPPEIPSADVKSLRPLKMVRTSQFPNKLCAILFFIVASPKVLT